MSIFILKIFYNCIIHVRYKLWFLPKCLNAINVGTSVFTAKRNLTAHQKNHDGVRFPCTVCSLMFSYKSHLNRHLKNIHGMYIV